MPDEARRLPGVPGQSFPESILSRAGDRHVAVLVNGPFTGARVLCELGPDGQGALYAADGEVDGRTIGQVDQRGGIPLIVYRVGGGQGKTGGVFFFPLPPGTNIP